jgi:phospholipid transport system substrate-binding protein
MRIGLIALMMLVTLAGSTQADARGTRGTEEAAQPTTSATAELQAHHAELRRVQAKTDGKRDEQTEQLVDALIDYAWLTDAALGSKAGSRHACEPRCAEVETLLARLVRRAYLRVLTGADRGEIEYLDEDRRPRATKVRTRVRWTEEGRERSVDVAYVMHVVDGRWMVRDVVTDGISLAGAYRHDFHHILQKRGIDGLVAQLEGKLSELAKLDK